MNFNEHQQICISQVVKIARLRGFAVDESDPKHVKLGLTWSGALQHVPTHELRPAIDEAWRWHDHSSPLSVEAIEDAWRSLQTRRAPESVQEIARMANCAHDFYYHPEETALFLGLWECIKCGKARPNLRQGNAADYLRSAGVTV